MQPRTIPTTGDDTPARNLFGYVRRMTGWHQVGAGALAVAVAVLGFAPVELQRRIVDDAIAEQDLRLLLILGGVYFGVLLLTQLLKVALQLYRTWLAESAAVYSREHLARLHCARRSAGNGQPEGETVSVLSHEVDKLAGFAGEGPSIGIEHMALLAAGVAYMLTVDAMVAAIGIALLVPQALLAPLMQRRLDRMIRLRVQLMRTLGDRIAGESLCEGPLGRAILGRIYRNRIGIAGWKGLTKAGLNLLNGLAPLSVLLVGGWLATQGETTVGVLVAFLSGFQRLADPLRGLIRLYRQTAQARVQHDMIARWM